MEFLPDFLPRELIEGFIVTYGYWAVFLVVGLESAGLPLPGEITLVSAALLAAATHQLDIGLILKVQEGTVKSRIFRARESVKTCLRRALGAP